MHCIPRTDVLAAISDRLVLADYELCDDVFEAICGAQSTSLIKQVLFKKRALKLLGRALTSCRPVDVHTHTSSRACLLPLSG